MDLGTFASFAVGPTSLALLGYQSAKIGWLLKRLREGDFVYRGLGTVDLLPYALPIEDGIVLNKNGSLTASWLYAAPDSGGLSDSEINESAAQTNAALKDLRNGWMLQTDLVRRPAAGYTSRADCHFPDIVCASIDEERRRLFERRGAVYQGYTVLTLSYLPSKDITKHFLRWINGEPAPTNKMSEALATFRETCLQLEKDLDPVVDTMLRLGRYTHPDGGVYDEQLRWINFCVTGRDHPIRIDPTNPAPMDAIVGTQDLYNKPSLRVGNLHIRCVAIDGFPELDEPTCKPTQLNRLCELPHAYRWNTRFIFLDPEQAEAEMRRTRKQWQGQTRSLRDQARKTNEDGINRDAENMVASAEAAIDSIRSGFAGCGYYSSKVIIMDEVAECADAIATDVLAAVGTVGFSGRIEHYNAQESFLGSLPSDARDIRRPHLDTDALANLLPLTSLWCGKATAPCSLYSKDAPNLMHTVTHGATPHWFNCHVGDVGHTLIFGPTRSGKSVLLNTIMAQARRYEDMKIFAFDIGLSMYALARAIHATTDGRSGQHYRLADDDGSPDLAPLQTLNTPGDRQWAADWIKTIMELNGITTTPEQNRKIEDGLRDLAKTPTRSMSELVIMTHDDEVKSVLRQYTRASTGLGTMFDGKKDALELSDFSVFEIKALMEADARFAIPALLYLFRRVERNTGSDPKLIVLDEGWVPLSHPLFRERLKAWFKAAAKNNCAVLLGTQGLSDVASSGIFATLNEQCLNKIFLPNSLALSDPDSAALYRSMGLSEHEIQRYIVESKRNRHYYQSTPEGKRKFELELGPFAKAFVAQTNIAAAQRVMALEKDYGNRWVDVYLQEKKLRYLVEAA